MLNAGGQTLAEYEAGKKVVAQSGLPGLPQDRRQRQRRAGAAADEHRHRGWNARGIARTLVNPTAPMPSFKNLPPQKFKAVVAFLSQLK